LQAAGGQHHPRPARACRCSQGWGMMSCSLNAPLFSLKHFCLLHCLTSLVQASQLCFFSSPCLSAVHCHGVGFDLVSQLRCQGMVQAVTGSCVSTHA
jgi:hypothetical protein